jgi:predicted ABC-type transport system involved in lysophospholipase L1 biosynthesis ATPase subunit
MGLAIPGTMEVQGLTHTAIGPSGRVDILRGADLGVDSGEFISVTGPPSSGKTTLFHLLAGLETPRSGRIRVAGIDLATLSHDARLRLLRRQIGLVSGSIRPVDYLTILENVGIPMALTGMASNEIEALARQALSAVGLDPVADRPISRLGGEERARLGIARALAPKPAILLADEPTESLSRVAASRILALLQSLVKERGTTLLLATSDADIAALADRELQLRDGRLHQAGTFASFLSPKAA